MLGSQDLQYLLLEMAPLNIVKPVRTSFLVLQISYYFYKTIIAISTSLTFKTQQLKCSISNIVESCFVAYYFNVRPDRVVEGYVRLLVGQRQILLTRCLTLRCMNT